MSLLGKKFQVATRYEGILSNANGNFFNHECENDVIDLSIGCPDFLAPKQVAVALSEVAKSNDPYLQQYSRPLGCESLVNVLAKMYSKLLNRQINPLTEFMITAGGYQALYCSILGHINPRDEVILIEPYFYSYPDMVAAAGGKFVTVPLRPKKTSGTVTTSDWSLDMEELKAAFNERTKIFMLNTPSNPLGKVFTKDELLTIAELCKKWNVLCISDEVYERLVYEPHVHIRIASIPGMWERTITIGSAGKVLGATGWKIGWAYGPEGFINNMQAVHRISVKTICTPTQEAVANIFEQEINRLNYQECSFVGLARILKEKRDYTSKFLTEIGMVPVIPDGGFFIVADWTGLVDKADLDGYVGQYKDYKFAEWMLKKFKVYFIPVSMFYSVPHKSYGENYVRVCFVKRDETLQNAKKILTSIEFKRKKL